MDTVPLLWQPGPGRSALVGLDGGEKMVTAAGAPVTAPLPEGVVTFLLTDVEGSSRLWERDEAGMRTAMSRHEELVGRAAVDSGGVRPVEQGEGDSVVIAFAHASQAAACALELQRELLATEWPPGCALRVRMALHSGEALLRDSGNYAGPAITRCARLRAIAHGGQTLLSRSTYELVAERLPDRASLRPLGLQRLKDLARAEEVFELLHPELPSDFPPPRSLDVLPNNLPVQLSSFVGRERELAEVARLLTDCRFVTLVGAGGCGKTRLAAQVAAEHVERYPDGAWWVDLAPLGDPGLVVSTLVAALGMRELPGQSLLDTVTGGLRDRRTLIVLDNCEHLVAEAAQVCERLLRGCPGVSLLPTSREPLGADGETDYRVPSLAVPAGDASLQSGQACEAVRLFVERARAGRPNFELSPESWPAVVSICAQLDGMPLALELAAARTRLLSPHQIADGLGERFALLSGGRRTALPRQQTLQHSVDWSYDLLEEEERAVLRRASVFAGGFDLEAAEAVCAGGTIDRYAVLEPLSRLVDKSLIQVEEGGAPVRYRLLETIRQYAGQKLADSDEGRRARDRHLDHYLALAEEAAPAIEGHDQRAWLDRLDTEHDNLRAAGDWAAACGDGDRQVRLAAALCFFWAWRGHLSEGSARAESALATGGGEPRARGMALLAQADTTLLVGDFAGCRAPAEDALAIGRESSDLWLTGRALIWIGWSDAVTGDPGARPGLRKAVEAAREAGDVFGLSFALNALGFVEFHQGGLGQARKLLREALALGRECGNGKAIYMSLSWLGWLLTETGEFRAADEALLEGLGLARELGDPVFVGAQLAQLTMLRMHTGGYEAARSSAEEGITLRREDRNPLGAWSLAALCWLEARAGDGRAGLAAGEEAVAVGKGLQLRRYTARWHCMRGEAAHAAGDGALAQTSWDAAAAEGRELGDAWPLGQALHGLAVLACEHGEPAQAEGLAHEALGLLAGAELWPAAIEVLETLAGIQVELGAPDRAARLIAAVEAERDRLGYPRPPVLARRLAPYLALVHSDDLAADRETGAGMTLQEAVAYASRGRGSRRRPAAGWASLTPAELEVVRLVAEGLTNPQIGERLFVSKRTVQAHLAHVFRKLDASNRAEVAAEAARREISAIPPA